MTAEFADSLARHTRPSDWPFHMPGHRGGAAAPEALVSLLGAAAVGADASELQGIDYLHDATGALGRAQARAAAVFGADRTWFLVNGATVGNVAAIAALAGDDDPVVLMRASHRSVYGGLAASGARPVYLRGTYDAEHELWLPPTVDEALAELGAHPATRALHVTSPSYYGLCVDVAGFATLAGEHGVALVVDEAHGAHFASGAAGLPAAALACGADVVVQSPHKTLSSLTQSSLLHVRGGRVGCDDIDRWLGVLQSTSPSALLLASLDVAVDAFAAAGAVPWSRAVALAGELAERLRWIPGVTVLGDALVGTAGVAACDPTKVVVDVSRAGWTGFAAAAAIGATHGVHPEFADRRRLVVSIGPGEGTAAVDLLVDVVRSTLAAPAPDRSALDGQRLRPIAAPPLPHHQPVVDRTPRRAAQAPSEAVPTERLAGRVAAEYVIPYPPGVPLVVPGERFDEGVVAALAALRAAGARIVGPADRIGLSVRCIAE